MNPEIKERLINYRRKNFAVETEKVRFPEVPNEFICRVTMNGYQWSTIACSPDEWRTVIKAIQKHLDSIK